MNWKNWLSAVAVCILMFLVGRAARMAYLDEQIAQTEQVNQHVLELIKDKKCTLRGAGFEYDEHFNLHTRQVYGCPDGTLYLVKQ